MMKVPFVNLGLQYKNLRDEIIAAIDKASLAGAYILGPEVEAFEQGFAKLCGTEYALGVADGTAALSLSLYALGVRPGDEVITAPNSFIASAGSIAAIGARPVFADVGDDYNVDPAELKKAITPKTRAIIPVHLTGRPAEMDAIMEIARQHNLLVVEDAAQAVGARYKGRRVGSFGNTGCFSLHPLKNLGVQGDGGAITTNDRALYERLKRLRMHGLINRDDCAEWGWNSRLDAIQAAIASIKLRHIDAWNARHRQIAEAYRQGLKDIVETPQPRADLEPVYHNFVLQTDRRDPLMSFLMDRGVETKIHYPICIHLQPAAASLGYKRGSFPKAERQAGRIVSLPIYPELEDGQVAYVVEQVRAFFQR